MTTPETSLGRCSLPVAAFQTLPLEAGGVADQDPHGLLCVPLGGSQLLYPLLSPPLDLRQELDFLSQLANHRF